MIDKLKSYALIASVIIALPIVAFIFREIGFYRTDRSLIFDHPDFKSSHQGTNEAINLLFVGTSLFFNKADEKNFAILTAEKLQNRTSKKVNAYVRAAANMSSSTVSANIDRWISETNATAVLILIGNGDLFNHFRYTDTKSNRFMAFLEETGFMRRLRMRLMEMDRAQLQRIVTDIGHRRIHELESALLLSARKPGDDKDNKLKKLELVRLYDDFDMGDKAANLLRSMGIEENDSIEILIELGFFYSQYKMYDRTEEILARIRHENGSLAKSTRILTAIMAKKRGFEIASRKEVTLRKEIVFDDLELFPALPFNYRQTVLKIKSIGSIAIPMQYPTRPLLSLKKILGDFPESKIIDNEQVFKQAVMGRGYDAVFSDHDIFDFGHLTQLGHDLMAENIVNFIQREYPGLIISE